MGSEFSFVFEKTRDLLEISLELKGNEDQLGLFFILVLFHTELLVPKLLAAGDKIRGECSVDLSAEEHPLFGIIQNVKAILLHNANIFEHGFFNAQKLLAGY